MFWFSFLLICGCFIECKFKEVPVHQPFVPSSHSGFDLVAPSDSYSPQDKNRHYHKPSSSNPLLEALLLSKPLGISAKYTGYNTLQHEPINPYIALLLSHYGKYIAVPGAGRGIYSYGAANNYHNNKPFGSYKISEEFDT